MNRLTNMGIPNPNDYPNLTWALRNCDRLSVLSQNLEEPLVEMATLEQLIKTLRDLGCNGIQVKFNDLNEKKIYSTIAELVVTDN